MFLALKNFLYRFFLIVVCTTLPACAFPGVYLEQGSVASGEDPTRYKQVILVGDKDLNSSIGRVFAEAGYDYYEATEEKVLAIYSVKRGDVISLNCNYLGQFKQDPFSTTARVICKATDLKTGVVLYNGIGEYMGESLHDDRSGAVRAALSSFPKRKGTYGTRLERLRLPTLATSNSAALKRDGIKVFLPRRTSPPAGVQSNCETGNWIESVMDDGRLIELSDGSVWQVVTGDETTSLLWLPTSEVLVCDGKIINTDDNESVEVMRLR